MYRVIFFIFSVVIFIYSQTDSTISYDTSDSTDVWESAFFSLGCSWQFGKNGLLDKWTDALEEKLEDIDIVFPDSLNPVLKISDNAPLYNVSFPVRVSFFPVVKGNRKLALNISWERLFKKFAASVESDSSKILYSFSKRVSANSFSIGTELYKKVSDKFFSVSKVNETDVFIGFSASPLNLLRIRKSENNVISSEQTGYGVGFSWRAGITLFSEMNDSKTAFSYGIAYCGSFYTHFMSDGEHLLYSKLLYNSNTDIIRYTSHSMQIFLDLIF